MKQLIAERASPACQAVYDGCDRRDPALVLGDIIGKSAPMQQVLDQVLRAAEVDSTVVIAGESGTGKELIAEALHKGSPRHRGPFVTVNMAAIPESLVESELFGHMRGAFTGSTVDRIGRFEAANGGTLFIDEIGDFETSLQAKLLRVLESRRISPVGANTEREVDVRVVAATNRCLEEMAVSGEFRQDLYYRLNVVTIFLPPLRARRSDIDLLVEHFLKDLCDRRGIEVPRFDREVIRFFQTYHWPGNIRQLRNCLESMVVMSKGPVLTKEDLPARMFILEQRGIRQWEVPQNVTLAELERKAITQSLERADGNRVQAARCLGISVRTLQRKLREWEPGTKSSSSLPR